MYAAGKRGDPKARRAIATMVAKAKKGDKQALSDVYAMKAARLAIKTDTAAAKHVARVAAYRAQSAKVVAARKRWRTSHCYQAYSSVARSRPRTRGQE